MKKLFAVFLPLVLAAVSHAEINLGSWSPLYKGIDHVVGTNTPDSTIARLQVVHSLRIDLHDPDVVLFPTPRAANYVAGTVETSTMTVSNFLKVYDLAVATDCNFYNAQPGGSDPTAEGLSCRVYGLQVCTGSVVSIPDTGPDSNGRYASILFTTNNQAIVDFNNRPPGRSTEGIYTAVSGYYPILSNSVNISAAAAISYPDPTIHGAEPRTLFGLSADRRYLFLTTIDGRQPGYSDGANDNEGAIWMLRLGASDAVNMDGGGSTAMYMADCHGNPVTVNSSSYVRLGRGRERIIGSHFGVYAKRIPTTLRDLTVVPGTTTAILRWSTEVPASTQVEYGSTPNFGNQTTLDSQLKREHVVTLTGLNAGGGYHFRAVSVAGDQTLAETCSFRTTNASSTSTLAFDVSAGWKYSTNNLDGVNWKTLSYDDSSWSGPGAGLLYIENNAAVSPRTTLLPPGAAGPVMRTYYFRTRFNFTGDKSNLALTFTSFVDDGAVFHLNGGELHRLRMPPAPNPIQNSTAATASPCAGTLTAGEAACADTFVISGNLLTNLVQGNNLLAVEVHNFGTSADIVFGTALRFTTFEPVLPALQVLREDNLTTLFWNGEGFTLQRSGNLSSESAWANVPGPITKSPFTTPTAGTTFYRLRR